MLKAKATINGRETFLIGLSHANLDKLRSDGFKGCIPIRAGECGLPFDIVITSAATEQEMVDAMIEGIGPHTLVHIDERLKS